MRGAVPIDSISRLAIDPPLPSRILDFVLAALRGLHTLSDLPYWEIAFCNAASFNRIAQVPYCPLSVFAHGRRRTVARPHVCRNVQRMGETRWPVTRHTLCCCCRNRLVAPVVETGSPSTTQPTSRVTPPNPSIPMPGPFLRHLALVPIGGWSVRQCHVTLPLISDVLATGDEHVCPRAKVTSCLP